jgi:hypothetical protein
MATAIYAKWTPAAERRDPPALAGGFADLVRAFKTLSDPYRPELHYMRGPGPKWHAKYDPAAASSADVAAVTAMVRVRAR